MKPFSSRPLLTAALLTIAGGILHAQGFLPLGGFTGNSHYSVEPVAAGFTATVDAVLSHGSIPAVSTYTSGISEIAGDKSDIKIFILDDTRAAMIQGVADGTTCRIFSVDGRMVGSTTVSDSMVSLPDVVPGNYMMHVVPAGKAPVVHRFIKRQ